MRATSLTQVIPLVLLLGCGSADPATGPPLPPNVQLVAFEPMPEVRRWSSGIDDPRRLVIRDRATWEAVWTELERNSSPARPAPEVDFTSRVVIFTAMGMRLTGGYAIVVEAVGTAEGLLYVAVLETSPGSGCMVTQALTQPVDAVLVPAELAERVSFVERRKVVDCR